jgi:hypothetical protein
MPNRYGYRKVRRAKNLYKKKKSGFRKVIETALLVVLVVGLGFVGFTVADTVINWVCGSCDEKPCVCEPTPLPDPTHNPDDHVDPTNEPPSEATPTEDGNNISAGSAVYAPSNVLSSSTTLSAFLETAKSDGYDSVVIEMKDDEGKLLYKSSIDVVASDNEINTGTLTAEQIAKTVTDAGLTPIARISTLKDHIAPQKLKDVSYVGWLDNTPQAGGKRWSNPHLPGTKLYIAQITSELHEAGFSDVVFANTIFPVFRGVDFTILPVNETNPETRFTALAEIVNNSALAGSNILIEVTFSDLAGAGGNPEGTAEILRNGSDSLEAEGLVLLFTASDFGTGTGSNSNSNSNSSVSVEKIISQAFSEVEKHSGKMTILPLLDRSGLSESDIEEISAAFESNGSSHFMVRN